MAKTKTRRTRSPHPGVKLNKRTLPSGRVQWRARYTDPDTGRETDTTLDPIALPTREARAKWAKDKSAELARRRMDRAAGIVPVKAPTALEAAIEAYRETAAAELKPKTIEGHELAIAKLTEWAARERVESLGDLNPGRLASLREYLIRAPKKAAAKSSKKRRARRGARVATAAKRSPVTVNRELRSLKTILNTWRQRGDLPGLHRDDIADNLAALPTPHDPPAFLPPSDLQKLIAAAMRHDAATFAETREEHAGRRERGTTARYVPIAPFVAFLILTGLRRGEALAVTWRMVDLDALDHTGRAVGEIRLPASATKTNRARTIGLEVSPALRKLLAAMKLRSGGTGHVFGGSEPYTVDTVEKARRRLLAVPTKERPLAFGAPAFDWQALRSTCGTYLTNAPGIFGAATVFMSAKQLGHSVAVAERHYLGVHRGIPREAHTLEAAMQIEGELGKLLAAVGAPAQRVGRGAVRSIAG